MITSLSNSRIKLLKRLLNEKRARRREQAFVVEGSRWIQEVVKSTEAEVSVFATPDWVEKQADLVDQLHTIGAELELVTPEIIAALADTQTPSGVIAQLPMPRTAWPAEADFILVSDGIRDPGNVGTLLRTAAAAGISGVLLAPGTVDPFNPKVVRSTMGVLLRLPIREASWDEIERVCQSTIVTAATGDGAQEYTQFNWAQPVTLIIGNEAHGISNQARQLASQSLVIPMHAETESLNAAIAAAVMLFEAQRQRRTLAS